MGYVVRMPQLGMTMEEGVVVEWTYEEGEQFEEGDVIAVVESEKTTNDVEAREDGVFLAKFVEPLVGVEPGDPIAYVGAPDEEVPADVHEEATGGEPAGAGAEPDEDAASAAVSGADGGPGAAAATAAKVSPRARSYAREHDLPEPDLGSLDGSGPGGAVVEADVIEAAEADAFGADGAAARGDVTVEGRGIYEEREASRVRQAVAERMTQSAREAPQVTLNRRVPVHELLNLKDRLAEDRGLELSLGDFLLAAVAEALEAYPGFNAVYEDGSHKLASNVNVGVAVDSEDGLMTPVVKGAGRRTLVDLAAERSRVVERVLEGEHTHDDLSGGTFTITNLGHFGVETFDPIVNPPQVAILGVGAVREAYDPERMDPRPEMGLSLTFDHRPVDGADAARFLDAVADALTHPTRLLTLGESGAATAGSGSTDGAGASSGEGPFEELDEPATDERSATATSEEGMLASVRSRQFEWRADEPEEFGGDDTAPNPVEQFLGSLASCLSLTVRDRAVQRDVPVEAVAIDVDAQPKEGSIERIDVDVMVVSDADEDDVESLVRTAERACYVSRVLDDDVERSLSLTVRTP